MVGEFTIVLAGELAVVMVGKVVIVNIMVAAGVTSVRDPSVKTARHSTTVPLYCGSAGMVSVSTLPPFSMIEPELMSGNSPSGEPFTLQVMIASDDVWRHLRGGCGVPNSTVMLEGTSANSV